MLAENLADATPALEPAPNVLLLPPVAKEGSGGDGQAASEQVDGGEGGDLDAAVGMEIEGAGDGDFMVDDEAEQVRNGSTFACGPWSMEMQMGDVWGALKWVMSVISKCLALSPDARSFGDHLAGGDG